MKHVDTVALTVRARGLGAMRGVLDSSMTRDFLELLELLEDGRPDPGAVAEVFGRLWEGLALEEERLLPDAWQSHLVGRVLDDENSFSLRAERGQVSASVPGAGGAGPSHASGAVRVGCGGFARQGRVRRARPGGHLGSVDRPRANRRVSRATRSLASSRPLETGERAWSFLRITTPGKARDPSAATGLSTGGRDGFGPSPAPTP